jgi:hypothetical protein
MAVAPFPIDPHLTGISLAYQNETLIAEAVLPTVGVSKQEFRWNRYDLRDGFTLPNTLVGRKSEPNKVEFGATEVAGFTKDYGLDDDVPTEDIMNSDVRHDPLAYATLRVTELIELDREVRVAAKVFDAALYAAGNKQALSGTAQWSDFVNSDPIGNIHDLALESNAVMMRPNVMVMGSEVWMKFARHPKILEAVKSTGGAINNGIAARSAIAQLFELEEVLVGRARLNTAKKGQPATMSRVWGKSALLFYRNRLATNQAGITLGYSAQWGSRVAGQMPEPNIGLRGAVRVRVGESREEVLAAPDVGFLFTTAVA